jgi:hypothetical protein
LCLTYQFNLINFQNKLRRRNFSNYLKVATLYKERNEEKRQEFIAKIKFEDFSKIVYIDELGLKNSMTDEYGWSLRGTPVYGEKKGRATEKLNIIDGLSNGKILSPLIYNYNTDSLLFNTWLEHHLIPELQEQSVDIISIFSNHQH